MSEPFWGPVRFLIGSEISPIYENYDCTRKVHNTAFVPPIEVVAQGGMLMAEGAVP